MMGLPHTLVSRYRHHGALAASRLMHSLLLFGVGTNDLLPLSLFQRFWLRSLSSSVISQQRALSHGSKHLFLASNQWRLWGKTKLLSNSPGTPGRLVDISRLHRNDLIEVAKGLILRAQHPHRFVRGQDANVSPGFGWEIHWQQGIIWGLLHGHCYTLWSPCSSPA